MPETPSGERKKLGLRGWTRWHNPLEFEEPAFAFDSSSVTRERAVSSDHPMTGDDDRDGICAIGQAYGSDGFGTTDASGDVRIGASLSSRDCLECAPNIALKYCALGGGGQLVEASGVSIEVALQLIAKDPRRAAMDEAG